jgi:hypothetical protein
MSAVYAAAAVRLPWWRYGSRLYAWSEVLGSDWLSFIITAAGMGFLVACFLAGWRQVRRGAARWLVWVGAAAFGLIAMWLLPITSDLFTYLSQAHLLTDLGLNPMSTAPLNARADALILSYPTRYSMKPSMYGPVWHLLSSVGTLGRHDIAAGLLFLKGLALVAFLGSGWLVERILLQIRPRAALEGLYLYAWNPFVVWMVVGEGHNDALMMALVLLSLWFLLRDRWLAALAFVVLSVWTKYVSAIFVPLYVVYGLRQAERAAVKAGGPGVLRRWAVLAVRGLAVAFLVSVLVLAPFALVPAGRAEDAVHGMRLVGRSSQEKTQAPLVGASSNGAASPAGQLPGLLDRFARPLNWPSAPESLVAWALAVGLALFAVLLVAVTWWLWREGASYQDLVNAAFCSSLLLFVLGAGRSQPWYLLWPATLGGLSNLRWAWPTIVVLSVVMMGTQLWIEWGTPGL